MIVLLPNNFDSAYNLYSPDFTCVSQIATYLDHYHLNLR